MYNTVDQACAAMNVQENRWVTNEIFCKWLNYFQLNVPRGVSKDNKHLILDDHCSHVCTPILNTCIKMELDIIKSIPSHHMQHLDLSLLQTF